MNKSMKYYDARNNLLLTVSVLARRFSLSLPLFVCLHCRTSNIEMCRSSTTILLLL